MGMISSCSSIYLLEIVQTHFISSRPVWMTSWMFENKLKLNPTPPPPKKKNKQKKQQQQKTTTTTKTEFIVFASIDQFNGSKIPSLWAV